MGTGRDDMKIDTLVLSAGGTHAAAYVGVINCLETRMMMNDIRNFYGTSAGSLACSMAACGLTSAEMLKILEDWGAQYKSPNATDLLRIPSDWGAVNVADALGSLLDAFIMPEETFASLAKRRGAMLSVYAYNVTKAVLTEFGIYTTPDMAIREAVLASCCVPFLYVPVMIGNDMFVDGAVAQRTPLHNVPCCKSTIAIDVCEESVTGPLNICDYFQRLTTGTSRHIGNFEGIFVTVRLPNDTITLLDDKFCHAEFKKIADKGTQAIHAVLEALSTE